MKTFEIELPDEMVAALEEFCSRALLPPEDSPEGRVQRRQYPTVGHLLTASLRDGSPRIADIVHTAQANKAEVQALQAEIQTKQEALRLMLMPSVGAAKEKRP